MKDMFKYQLELPKLERKLNGLIGARSIKPKSIK